MPYPTTCPHCRGEMSVPDGLDRGDAVECPLCRKEFDPPDRPDADRPRRRPRRYTGTARGRAATRLNGPAAALQAIGWINVVLGVLNLLVMGGIAAVAVGVAAPGAAGGPPGNAQLMQQGVIGFLQAATMILAGAAMVYGARHMAALSSYGWAVAAAVLAVLPCNVLSCCMMGAVVYVVGLVFGIMALVALFDADVKEQFGGGPAADDTEGD